MCKICLTAHDSVVLIAVNGGGHCCHLLRQSSLDLIPIRCLSLVLGG